MESRLRRLVVAMILLCSLVATLNVLPLPEVSAATGYNLFGAINEQGYYDSAINCTLYRTDDSPLTVEVDGWQNVTETQDQIVWKWDLGYNETRSYYLMEGNETIYVVIPTEPYYTYYFSIVDYLGVSNSTHPAYLETLINVNGTDTVVERWRTDVLNQMPFTCTWGTAYKMRLVCSRGTYYYPTFVAGASTTALLTVTSDMFPVTPTDINQLTVSAVRSNSTYIQSVYSDALSETTWIYMAVYESGNATVITSTNVTANTLTWNWYGADNQISYYVRIIALHDRRGELEWIKLLPVPYTATNPWSGLTAILGDNFPISPDQFIGIGILLFFFAVPSYANAGVGVVLGVITAMILTYIGWLDMGWTWLTSALAIAFIVLFSMYKEKETAY